MDVYPDPYRRGCIIRLQLARRYWRRKRVLRLVGITLVTLPDRLVHGHLGAGLTSLGTLVRHPRRYLVPVFADLDGHAQGVGLAGNQIGIARQIIVVDISEKEKERKHIVLINPVISEGKGCVSGEEGCLSVIEYGAKVERFQKIRITAQDQDGEQFDFTAEDWIARIIQHEVDHLHGILFIDRISRLKQSLYKKKLKKILNKK